MNTSLTFLNSSWFWPAFIGWLILMLVFFWKEWKTSVYKRLVLKMILAALGLTAIFLIILEPAVQQPAKGKDVIIITEYFDQVKLDSLQKKHKKARLIDYREEQDLLNLKEANQIFVLGSGLANYDLHLLKNLPVDFLPGQFTPGIIKLNYNKQNQTGDVLKILGEFARPNLNRQLLLEDASGNALDSVELSPGQNQQFSLSTPLKVPGDFIYTLSERDSTGQLIKSNPLPISVYTSKPLDILIFAYQPTFEIKYLKNFLAEQEHALAVKSRITRNRFKYEYFNRPKKNISRLNSAMLEDFDLLIMDKASLKSMSASQQATLLRSIENDGLGLLILGNTEGSSLNPELTDIKFETDRTSEVTLNHLPEESFSKEEFKLRPKFGLKEIHKSDSDIISAYYRKAKGRVGTTVLTQTWQLKLEGKEDAYQQVWSELLEQLSKRESKTITWTAMQQFAFKDEPFEVELQTGITNPSVLTGDKDRIPLHQDLYTPERWKTRVYPKTSGWHELKAEQDSLSVFKYYVHQNQDWKSIKAYQNRVNNKRFFSEQQEEKNQETNLAAINPIWFFIVFLLAMAGLWLEPKL